MAYIILIFEQRHSFSGNYYNKNNQNTKDDVKYFHIILVCVFEFKDIKVNLKQSQIFIDEKSSFTYRVRTE